MVTWGEWQQISDALNIKRHDEIFPEGGGGFEREKKPIPSPFISHKHLWSCLSEETNKNVCCSSVGVDKAA